MNTLVKGERPYGVKAEPVLFDLYAPGAHEVYLAGDFNQWNTETIEMQPGQDGNWLATLVLPRGRHEYKYFTDGEWTCGSDLTAHGTSKCVVNAFGTLNCVIDVH